MQVGKILKYSTPMAPHSPFTPVVFDRVTTVEVGYWKAQHWPKTKSWCKYSQGIATALGINRQQKM